MKGNPYEKLEKLRKYAEKVKQWDLKAILDEIHQRGENAGGAQEIKRLLAELRAAGFGEVL